ncbi:hypothetical protein [Pseudomonas sp.]
MQPGEPLFVHLDPAGALRGLGCAVEGAAQAVAIEQGEQAIGSAGGEQ